MQSVEHADRRALGVVAAEDALGGETLVRGEGRLAGDDELGEVEGHGADVLARRRRGEPTAPRERRGARKRRREPRRVGSRRGPSRGPGGRARVRRAFSRGT